MTKEQMLEQWTRIYEQGYYKCAFTPKVYEYLDEKTDQVPETVMYFQRYMLIMTPGLYMN